MTNTQLLIRLRDLHEELSGINVDLKMAEQVDEETIDALGQLVTDASSLVDQANSVVASKAIEVEHQDLVDRVIRFENRHPRVAEFLNQMTDFLVLIGI